MHQRRSRPDHPHHEARSTVWVVLGMVLVGDAAAAATQQRLAPLGRDIVGTMSVPGVKAALDLVGLTGGQPRPPLLPLSLEATTLVRTLLHEAGVPAVA